MTSDRSAGSKGCAVGIDRRRSFASATSNRFPSGVATSELGYQPVGNIPSAPATSDPRYSPRPPRSYPPAPHTASSDPAKPPPRAASSPAPPALLRPEQHRRNLPVCPRIDNAHRVTIRIRHKQQMLIRAQRHPHRMRPHIDARAHRWMLCVARIDHINRIIPLAVHIRLASVAQHADCQRKSRCPMIPIRQFASPDLTSPSDAGS